MAVLEIYLEILTNFFEILYPPLKLALFYEFQQQINNKMCKFHQLFK